MATATTMGSRRWRMAAVSRLGRRRGDGLAVSGRLSGGVGVGPDRVGGGRVAQAHCRRGVDGVALEVLGHTLVAELAADVDLMAETMATLHPGLLRYNAQIQIDTTMTSTIEA